MSKKRELPEIMLTVDEAAERLKLSTSYTKKLISRGVVPSVTVGRARRVRLSDLRAYTDRLQPDIVPPCPVCARAAS